MPVRSSSFVSLVTLADVIQVNHDVSRRSHPEALRPFLSELDAFARHNHFNVLHPILRYIIITSLVDLSLMNALGSWH